MTMKTIGVKYLRAKNKEVANGLDLVIQTDGMQLVGVARLFSRTDRGEEGRRMYLEDKTEPYFFAKAVGYRVYISLYSTLADYYTQEEVRENKYEIHHYLQEMAQFYAENMTEGMRRQYADDDTSL